MVFKIKSDQMHILEMGPHVSAYANWSVLITYKTYAKQWSGVKYLQVAS